MKTKLAVTAQNVMIALALTIASSSAFAGTVVCIVDNKAQTYQGCRLVMRGNSPIDTASCLRGNGVESDFTQIKGQPNGTFKIRRSITFFANDLLKRQDVQLPTLSSHSCVFKD